ncbi:hypothetical protein CAEBREN_03139 [Caenorhabditis brenneri]|uniref:Sdz-33 F-box domain-containing protein n=1 Tax=Caenorhabditis brenneri TaxID=135651 RepID=G0NS90_CAEBE|nr:hypothetical protein CAEBREN_03139 [Caenorhabditis brenneri]
MLPLYKLDVLSLEQIFKSFDLKEIIALALLSTRSFIIARSLLRCTRPENVSIDLEIRRRHKITVYRESEMFRIYVMNNCYLREGKRLRNVLEATKSKFQRLEFSILNNCDGGISTYWEDENIAIRMLYEYISSLFYKPITELVYQPKNGNMHLDLLESIMKNQNSLPNAMIRFTGSSWLGIDRAMRVLSVAQNITLDVTLPNFWIPKYKYQNLTIEYGNWVNLPELKGIDCESLYLCQTFASLNPLKDRELKEFVNMWMSGCFPNLKDFRLETNSSISLENILMGISTELSGIDRFDIEDEYNVLTGGPLNIRQLNNGQVATVYTVDFENSEGEDVAVFVMIVAD